MFKKVTFNIFPKYFTSQRGHTKIFIILELYLILHKINKSQHYLTISTNRKKINHFYWNSRWQRGPTRQWEQRDGEPLTGTFSPAARSPAAGLGPTWSPWHCAHTGGTSWSSRSLERPCRRRWWLSGARPTCARRFSTSPTKLRSSTYLASLNRPKRAVNWANRNP